MTKRTALLGMLVALAFVFSYIEFLIPVSIGIPGVKLGLANLVVIVALYTLGAKQAFLLSLVRIVLTGFTFGNPASMLFSLSGGMLSLLIMLIAKKTKLFSVMGTSILGGVFHNVGQIITAALVVQTKSLLYYLPVIIISGVAAGIVIGILGAILIKRLQKVVDIQK